MAVSLNTISVATPTRGTLSAKKGEAASYNVIPVKNATDTVAFTGSKKPHPVKTFLGALAVTFGLGAPSATMTSCDPIPDIDTTVVTPPKVDTTKVVVVDDSKLSPIEKAYKRFMGQVYAADTTKSGALDSLRAYSGLSGQQETFKTAFDLSTKDKIVSWTEVYDDNTANYPQYHGREEFFIDPVDGLRTINVYESKNSIPRDPEQILRDVRKFTNDINPTEIVEGTKRYTYLPADSISVYQKKLSTGTKFIIRRVFSSVK